MDPDLFILQMGPDRHFRNLHVGREMVVRCGQYDLKISNRVLISNISTCQQRKWSISSSLKKSKVCSEDKVQNQEKIS